MCFLKKRISLPFFFLILVFSSLAAQDSSRVDFESQISITGSVAVKEIPLNRFLTFTVKVEWFGDFKRFQISEVETPIVENFEIYSTSASDKRSSSNGTTKAAKIYEFTLRPQSLGMGYIEGVVVKYLDLETDEAHHLMTNRINVKVIDSVPEPGEFKLNPIWIIVIVVVVLAVVGLLFWRSAVNRKRIAAQEQTHVVVLEEEYLTMLRESLDLNSPGIKINEAFWTLSKILRKYLSQKYDFSAMGSTTENIIQHLQKKDIDESLINNIEETLNKSDLAKFAGSEGDRQDLDRSYTLIESMLEKNLARHKLENLENEK